MDGQCYALFFINKHQTPTMNGKENALAAELLDMIQHCARTEPEKALQLSEAYKNLCAAFEIRVRAENDDSD